MVRQDRYTYTPICDGCGTELDAEWGYLEAVSAMKLDGWQIVRSKNSAEYYHFCPVCKERRKGNG